MSRLSNGSIDKPQFSGSLEIRAPPPHTRHASAVRLARGSCRRAVARPRPASVHRPPLLGREGEGFPELGRILARWAMLSRSNIPGGMMPTMRCRSPSSTDPGSRCGRRRRIAPATLCGSAPRHARPPAGLRRSQMSARGAERCRTRRYRADTSFPESRVGLPPIVAVMSVRASAESASKHVLWRCHSVKLNAVV